MSDPQRALLEKILQTALPQGSEIWIFGSRTRADVSLAADLDLLIDARRAITLAERAELESGFEFSTLPYRVDVVDMHTIQGIFAENVMRDRVLFFRVP